MFAIAGLHGSITIINLAMKAVQMVLSGHGNAVNQVQFSSLDRFILFSASKDISVRMWNFQTGTCIASFSGHQDEILGIDIHLSGSRMATASIDNEIKIWDLQDPTIIDAVKASFRQEEHTGKPYVTKLVQFPLFSRRVRN